MVDTNTVEVTFNEAITQGTIDDQDFDVTENGNAVGIDSVTTYDKKTFALVLSDDVNPDNTIKAGTSADFDGKDAANNTGVTSSLKTAVDGNAAVDITAPKVYGVANGGTYASGVKVTFNEGTATLNGSAYTADTAITAEDDYVLVVTDAAGNATTVNFSVDATAPTALTALTITVTATGATGTAEAGATVKVVADGGLATATAVKSVKAGTDGSFTITGLTAGTSYEVFVIDAVGNASAGYGITTSAS